MSRVANGWFLEHITQTTQSKSLNQLKHTINNALKILEKRFDTINSVFESYAKYDYTHKLTLENVEPYTGSDLVAHLAVNESGLTYGSSTYNFVTRLFVPDANGTPVDFSSNA
jgi:hypothetical protein